MSVISEEDFDDWQKTCGKAFWTDDACQTCDSCKMQRANARNVLAAANDAVAWWEADAPKDECDAKMAALREALGDYS